MTAIAFSLFAVVLLLYFALDSFTEAAVVLVTIPVAFVGGIAGLLLARETWNVSSLVGLIGLFGDRRADQPRPGHPSATVVRGGPRPG